MNGGNQPVGRMRVDGTVGSQAPGPGVSQDPRDRPGLVWVEGMKGMTGVGAGGR